MENQQRIYLSSNYLPNIQYFTKMVACADIYVDLHEHYLKQSYRNRCNILSANGLMSLSIPVEHSLLEKIAMKDVKIAQHGNWQHLHWNALVSAYNSSPFFEYYSDDFYRFYHSEFEFLVDLNEELREMICSLLNLDCMIQYTAQYKDGILENERDFRNSIHPKKDWKDDTEFVSIPYYQVFESRFGFIPNASIVDLLFNMGPESLIVLNNGIVESNT